MSNICVSCNSADTSIRKFLLRCDKCSTRWHHRCHKPPVSDPELIAIIARFNEEKKAGKPNPAFVWRCGSCSGLVAKLQTALPKRDIHQDSTPLATRSNPTVQRPPENRRSIAIDDEIVILENPFKQVSSAKQVKTSQIFSKASRDFPPDPTAGSNSRLVSSTIVKKTVHKPQTSTKSTGSIPARATKTVTTRPSGIRIIDDPFVERSTSTESSSPTPAPFQPPTRPPLGSYASSSSTAGSSALVPGLLDLHMSRDRNTTVRATTQELDRSRREDTLECVTPPPQLIMRERERAEREDTLEYVTPPPPTSGQRKQDVISRGHTLEYVTPPPPPPGRRELDVISRGHTLEYVTPPPPSSSAFIRTSMPPPPLPPSRVLEYPRVAHSLPPIAAISEAPARRPLLSTWIRDSRGPASTAEPDIWQRSAVRRLVRTGVTVSSSSSSGKFKAQNLARSVGKEAKPSQNPFFFTADVWLKAKKGV